MALASNTVGLESILEAVNSLPNKVDTSGTATEADIYTGKTATVNDKKLTGNNPYNAANVDPAVADALAALAEKGVDTTGAGLANLAALIAGIEAGGGNGRVIESGSVTFASRTATHTFIDNSDGSIEQFMFFCIEEYTGITTETVGQIYAYFANETISYYFATRSSGNVYLPKKNTVDLSRYPLGTYNQTSDKFALETKTYNWIAIKKDGAA